MRSASPDVAPRRLIALVGPTASGKSAAAARLAQELGGEILCCDSVQIYRGFSIGCAKPSAAEQRAVRHHLIDLVPWSESFDAAHYVRHAAGALADMEGRGTRPILCGGTGLYQRALRYGLVDVPPRDPAIRRSLEADEARAPGTLWARLLRVDPTGAQRIEPHNLVQIIRALEISMQTGEPASQVRARHGFNVERVPMRVVVLSRPRQQLRQRIRQRLEAMLAQGWIGEVEALLADGVGPDSRPMRAVGYRQVCEVVRGAMPAAGLADRIAVATWHYAKRQLTWFRREDATWLEVESVDEAAERLRHVIGAKPDRVAVLDPTSRDSA